ncbi:hypothetical protein J2Z21_005619 [Streptomyces griseochromogenes]|uniref:Uncharacterized protein n=1 Tax=Streptomyces griseochromogenes TaxID=68214 RepID=A0A1B1BAD5_9ACTN|nr:hypothetical protein [Streptomyces griseochromogenes]ANP55729.1 hypothetical protein AVL59_44510 [Streptomyces griseochromogenes]MBP2052632.1 hypothetical protein [Streptomyces griseochromogenes]
MTQSGQGEEPSARPAREGIVLPSDGGEPLVPGLTGAPAPAGPAGGQAWGGPWGPGPQQAPQPDQGWPPAPAQQWGAAEQQPASGNGPGPLPPEGAPAAPYGGQAYGSGGGQPQYGGPQPAYGDPAAYQQQYQAPPAPAAQAPLPPAVPDAYPAQSAPHGAPPPPAAEGATQYLPPVPPAGGGIPAQAPVAAPADEGATQYLPPVPAASAAEGATQYLPPVPAASAPEGATQYIPPVMPGALPPESAAEETRYLGRAQQPSAPAAHPDAQATQYIPPYTGQAQGAERKPPAEFDNLFRSGPGGAESPAGATQQMPRVQQPNAYPGPAQPSYSPPLDEDEGRRGGSGRSKVPLIAALGIGIIVVGVGAGALLSGGGGDKGDDSKTVAASGPATQDSASAADPAKQQAVALDKLLSDSGSSRASVIQAVANVKRCDSLDQSASDLRDAAKQRSGLVTRLGRLSVDKLPGNAELTDALTKAWQASAAADNHYAAWADQVGGGRKGCHKGQARATGQAQAGNRESGTASAQKVKAAALWNTIAKQYGLTQRQPTQL